MGNKKDYSYIQFGYEFPVSHIKCLGEEYERRDNPTIGKPKGTLRHYVKCECPFCKSEFEGRLDRLEFNPEKTEGPRTLCCKSCSLIHKRPFEDPWRNSEGNHAEKNGININRTENLEGQYYGDLLVLAPELGKTDKFGMAWWMCRCACGNEELVRTNVLRGTNIRNGHERCACSKCLKTVSSGERAVQTWFENHSIKNYKHHVKFEELRGLSDGMLDFDFGIGNIEKEQYQYLIEFQGGQHYKFTSYFHKTIKDFERQQEHDNRKRKWCEKNKIQLIAIPYTYKNIEDYLTPILKEST